MKAEKPSRYRLREFTLIAWLHGFDYLSFVMAAGIGELSKLTCRGLFSCTATLGAEM